MTALWKAVRPDGTDIRTGTIDYGAALLSGEVVRHPTSRRIVRGASSTYLSASTEPADCTGMRWPCRLLRVEPVGLTGTDPTLPHKRTMRSLRVVGEEPAWMALGPNGREVAALIDRAARLTPDEVDGLVAAWEAAREAAWEAARAAAWEAAWAAAWAAAWEAARAAAWEAAWEAARAAAWACVVRDLIDEATWQALAGPWLSVIGDPRDMVGAGS